MNGSSFLVNFQFKFKDHQEISGNYLMNEIVLWRFWRILKSVTVKKNISGIMRRNS